MLKRFLTLSLALVLAVGALAQKNRVDPEVAKTNAVKLITEIDWQDDLSKMLKQAREEDKLVFYMHMLGDMKGAT
jgi:hypothetical protein